MYRLPQLPFSLMVMATGLLVMLAVFGFVADGASCGGTAGPSAAYASLVSDQDIKTYFRLSDESRGTVQVLAPFSNSVLQRPGIAATLAAIKEAEIENRLPFYMVNVTTFNYDDTTDNYSAVSEISAAILEEIINNTASNVETFPYSAIMGLDYIIADTVITTLAATKNTSRIPIFNPMTANGALFTNAYSNVLHYKPSFVSEVLHMIRFAFTNLNCANSDLHIEDDGDVSSITALINTVFVAAGFPAPKIVVPPEVGIPNATAGEIFIHEVLTEGMENRNVQCVFVVDVFRNDLYNLLLTDPRGASYFKRTSLLHFSTGANTIPSLSPSEASYHNKSYFVSTEPDMDGTSALTAQYKAALTAFNANHTEADHKRMNYGTITNSTPVDGYYPGDVTEATAFGYQTYVTMRWFLELLAKTAPSPRSLVQSKMLKRGVCNITELNLTQEFSTQEGYPLQAPHSEDILSAAYDYRVLVSEDFAVGPLMPSQCPLSYGTTAATCFCNIGSKILSMSKFDSTTIQLKSYVATSEFGAATDVTTIVPERKCSLELADIVSSMPSTLMYINNGEPTSIYTQLSGSMITALAEYANSIADSSFTTTVRSSIVDTRGYTEYEIQQAFAEAVNSTSPIILLGSGEPLSFLDENSSVDPLNATTASGNYETIAVNISVAPTSSLLSLANGIDYYALEDPPLVSSSLWNSAHVNLRATFADHAHAIAAYYTDLMSEPTTPTSLSAIVESSEQAALVGKSFTTFGTTVSVAVLSQLGGTTAAFRAWLASAVSGGGDRPFVFVGLMTNTSLALELLHIINGTTGVAATASKPGLRFAVASSEDTMFDMFTYTASNALLEMFNQIRQGGFQIDMFIEAPTTSSLNLTSLFTRTTPLTIDTSNPDAPDIVFASHLNEWYLPRSTTAMMDPSAFRRLEVVRVALSILTGSSTVASTTGVGILYDMINVAGIDSNYGPFYKSACTAAVVSQNSRLRSCQCAKGPRTFQMISFLDYYLLQTSNRTKQFSYTNEGCGVVYRDAIASANSVAALSTEDIVGVAVGGAAAIGIVLGFCVCFFCCRRCFSVRHAPKDSSVPFAMAFTDIQSSTTLWARVPEAMAASVDAHHTLLRECVSTYQGYEVKTIGDSFMVAFHTADAAAKFALGVQMKLFTYHLWGPEIDETYIETLLEAHKREQENAEIEVASVTIEQATNALMGTERGHRNSTGSPISTESPLMIKRRHSKKQMAQTSVFLPLEPETGELDHDMYDRMWCGLRVRVGIHYGVGEIKLDPVSDRYDYYGTVVNTAARVEGVGHGGQVLLTEDAFQALSPNFEKDFSVAIDALGPQPLRGLDAPIALYQLTPLALFERTFPPLRLDIEKVAEEIDTDDDSNDDDDSNSNSTSNTSSVGATQTRNALNVHRKKFLNTVSPWSPEATADKIVAKELKIMMLSKKANQRESDKTNGSIGGSMRDDKATFSPTGIHLEGGNSVWDRIPDSEPATPTGGGGDSAVQIEGNGPQELDLGRTPKLDTHTMATNFGPMSPTTGETPTTSKTLRSREGHETTNPQAEAAIAQHDASRSKVLSFYYFMETALSTLSIAQRSENISHMAKKWQVKASKHPSLKLREKLAKRGAGSKRESVGSQASRNTHMSKRAAITPPEQTEKKQNEAYDQMYLLVSLCAKVGKAATVRQAQSSRKFAN